MATNKLERVYTIPLRRSFIKVPKYYRAKRAINDIKRYVVKHMKSEDVRIGNVLNEHVWSKGITNPPGKVTVNVIKQDDYVSVELEGHVYKVHKVQTEKTDKPTSFKDKLAAKLKQPKEDDSSEKKIVKKPVEKSVESKKEVVVDSSEEKAVVSSKESVESVDSKAN